MSGLGRLVVCVTRRLPSNLAQAPLLLAQHLQDLPSHLLGVSCSRLHSSMSLFNV
jgi:hypothetical protein